MSLHGKNMIAGRVYRSGSRQLRAVNPKTGEELDPLYLEATEKEVELAFESARDAHPRIQVMGAEPRAHYLRLAADHIEALGDELIERGEKETGLPAGRLQGERGRTVNQLRLFADLVEEGSWVDARIDLPEPDREPVPKPDMRRMLIGIGPVVVFGASNFPLAFSVAGGDTASALAAGNPVIVKAHPAHPGVSELVAKALVRAAEEAGMPPGIFSLVHGKSHEIGQLLVQHPAARAVGFTGSLKGGRALFDAAVRRPEPIPVYAEMGSINPLFILPQALADRGEEIAEGLHQSILLGVGQFCTNPGLVVIRESEGLHTFLDRLKELVEDSDPGVMLHAGICEAYKEGVRSLADLQEVDLLASGPTPEGPTEASGNVLITNAEVLLRRMRVWEEVFGPSTLIAVCHSDDEVLAVARHMRGQLTATVHATSNDVGSGSPLMALLRERVGRLIMNGFPTGLEVCPSTHHGGPYPATTDVRTTSVGTAAIERFARPICYQDFAQNLLPPELRNANDRKIWRMINGTLTKDDIEE